MPRGDRLSATSAMFDALINTLAGKRSKPVVLQPDTKAKGSVALSYLAWPLVEGWNSPSARGHTNAFEVVAMAEAWRKAGFRVEVCDYTDTNYRPSEDCRFAIDLHGNLERWHPSLPGDCIRILHATGCDWRFQNQAEQGRLTCVLQRRGVALKSPAGKFHRLPRRTSRTTSLFSETDSRRTPLGFRENR